MVVKIQKVKRSNRGQRLRGWKLMRRKVEVKEST